MLARSTPVALTVIVLIAGCAASSAERSSTGVAGSPQARAVPYQLYTHCGIEWARINHTFWRAQHPLSDGSGNPPAGWGNPVQSGTLTFTDAKTARFTSRAGTVIFNWTDRARPPFICS